MTFKSWNAELLHASESKHRLEQAAEREWFLGDLLVRIRVSTAQREEKPLIWVNISTWRKQEGTTAYDRKNNPLRQGGYFEYEHDPLALLTSAQLHRVAACREVAEAWIAGEISELPEVAPAEIAREGIHRFAPA